MSGTPPAVRASTRWLLRRPSEQAWARIFCFPYSGVGASLFNRWPRTVDGAEVCPVQLPGRESRIRDAHFGTYQELARAAGEALTPYLDRPFTLFGHCAGALAAFETARQLAALGLPAPDRLVVSAQVAPHDCPSDRFLELDDTALSAELATLVQLRGGRPHPDLIGLTLEVLHRDLDASRVYRLDAPQPLPGGITVLHWRDDAEVTFAELGGWGEYSPDVRFRVLDGAHYQFLSAPADLMRELLPEHAAEGPS